MPCNGVYSVLSIFFLSIAVIWVAAVPAVQVGPNTLRRDLYGAAKPEFFPEYLDDRGRLRLVQDPTEARDQTDDLGGNQRVRPSERYGYALRGFNLPSDPTTILVGDDASPVASISAELFPDDRLFHERSAKRNIDEIDRTAFDNFFKRNIDEIYRTGWSGFMKRFAAKYSRHG